MEIILLFGAGLIAGAINSLAGGGSFVAFPALLLAGVPVVVANATNTFAAWPGYVSGAIGYWTHIRDNRHLVLPYAIAALIGGYLGAELLLRISDAQFSIIVPWLMGLAVFLFAFGGRISEGLASLTKGNRGAALAIKSGLLVLLTLICVYGGFFNAGLGIILLAFFALAGLKNIHALNGLKLMISGIVASVAVVRFALDGSIAWYEGSLVFAGTLVGGYGAARLAHLIPPQILRRAIIFYAVVLTGIFFWRAYF